MSLSRTKRMASLELFERRRVAEGGGELVDGPRAACALAAKELRAAIAAGAPREELEPLEHALDVAIAEIEKDAPIGNRRARRAEAAARRRGVQ